MQLQTAPKDGCCVKTVTQPGDIPGLRVVPDTPTPRSYTITLAGLAAFARVTYAAGRADALAGP